ncbi:MAG: phosphatidylglycerol lysyltransferase domain-containing protein [Desulfobacterales bacterium]|nr:phosphatidylglycerol lysyltransferase domain-containing protein [Desulfobacterales bacterium]
MCWAWENDLVWLKQTKPEVCYWAPIGAWQEINWPERFTRLAITSGTFIRIPDEMVHIWKTGLADRLQIESTRAQWDYLYGVSDLVNLRGNRFHKKKNLLYQFQKNYDFTYRTLGPDTVELALAMQTDWCSWRDCESSENLSAENRLIERVLKNWDRFSGLTGGVLTVNQKMVAYTVAEPLTKDMLLIHFEKASSEFKGVYQAINQMFLSHSAQTFKVVNREQDLGDEGLRKAKLSYHPVEFLPKSKIEIS